MNDIKSIAIATIQRRIEPLIGKNTLLKNTERNIFTYKDVVVRDIVSIRQLKVSITKSKKRQRIKMGCTTGRVQSTGHHNRANPIRSCNWRSR